MSWWVRWGKRFFDVGAVLILGVLATPLVVLVGLLVLVTMGRPVFFRQTRLGWHGKPFTIVKFRTMTPPRPADDPALGEADRITPLGRILRLTSLDELPTLWNVLRGDMSLVGPRPLLPQYWDRYTPEQARRHEVKPGITGWAQVNGRNALSWEEKFTLDVWYVDHQTLWLDLRILAMTVRKVLKREGISAKGHPTMPEFMGTDHG